MRPKTTLKYQEILTRGVQTILPGTQELGRLMQQKKIRLYLGIDPTSPQLHLGHSVLLRKLSQFQQLGHEAILLFGTFTARIGDPSGRSGVRSSLTMAQIEKNMAGYKEQVSKVISLSGIKIEYNHRWLGKLYLEDILRLTSCFTVSRLLERDMFQARFKKGEQVGVNEFLYPLLQGYDSVALDVDLEIGAEDQTFNMLVGRKLQQIYHHKEKFILTVPTLLGLDGRKMSKTYGNTVNIADPPKEMYGKIMSVKDELIIPYFELCTDEPLTDLVQVKNALKSRKLNPREAKAHLARTIVAMVYDKKTAREAEAEFDRVYKDKKIPSEISQVRIPMHEMAILNFLTLVKVVSSKAEAKRLIQQRGVKIDGQTQEDWRATIMPKRGQIIQIGRRKFIKIA